jgi:glycosyltransferase involved in cell wall biosynthesis
MTINGVPDSAALGPESVPLNVLFLARLHARKRPVLFVKMAEQLIREGHDATFSLVGPDEGEGAAVTALIQAASIGDRVRWEGSLRPEETLERIARCGVYVLPSVGEVFPMSVLEAMSAGRPIVVTQSNGLASNLSESDAALVVDESLEALVSATRSLIVSKELRSRMGQNAKISASREYSMVTVIDQVERAYEKHLIVGQLS